MKYIIPILLVVGVIMVAVTIIWDEED